MQESADVRRWLSSGAGAVKRARDRLDSINVFPVADSDTGTNVYLTLQEGNRAVAKLPDNATHREVVAAFARGTLLGARGNSGVIVSQYLTAFLSSIDDSGGLSRVNARGIARALEQAADAAYKAVGTPVEGTMLTVARAAAAGAQQAVAASGNRDDALLAAITDARVALAATHDQLPKARAAGVVDAGAAALVLQLEMLAETLGGPHVLDSLEWVDWGLSGAGHSHHQALSEGTHAHEGSGAYEVMFVVESDEDLHAELTRELEAIGDSVAVTGVQSLWQAHVHTDSPHQAVARGVEARAHQIVVRNVRVGHDGDRASTGIVALTQCPGLAEPLADAGAIVLVVPEPTALKRRALRRAVKDASGRSAVVVAGHPSLRAAAEDIARKPRKTQITVIDAQHEAQVLAAVAAATLVTPGQDLAEEMAAAVAATTVGQSSGDALDGDVDRLVDDTTEVVSLILAAGVPAGVADPVRLSLRARTPQADVHVYHGQQDHPPVLIGVERQP